ncbi:MAG TPA: hypothetical protein VHO84_05180 [Syntrophorhabdaceae bacterium]|nr:hypothetical protein [Syntrophorhabdaceae bacterium]
MTDKRNKAEWITDLIEGFVASQENGLGNSSDERMFGVPLVGFAAGDDPLFEQFKRDIGSFYLTPVEAFEKAFPGTTVEPEKLTVISWILPHVEQTKSDSRKEKDRPSERWARGKQLGVLINVKLQKYLIEKITATGYRAMAPCSPPFWSERISERFGRSSTWSERHAAYVAGLGTFGLCDGLITSAGKAMRCGSLIAQIEVPATVRPYQKHTEYCLFLSQGICGVCMKRCPVGAITEKGHDKEKCKAHVDGVCVDYSKEHYGIDINVCGLCQTGVPCESRIPLKNSRH